MDFVDRNLDCFLLLAAALLLTILLSLAVWADSITCHSKWINSGLPVQYGVLSGCQVYKNGWIPADNYRVF